MKDLVQKKREIEKRDSQDERQRDPNDGMLDSHESPHRQHDDENLPERDDEMTSDGFSMERPKLIVWNGASQFRLQLHRMPGVVMSLQPV